MPGWQYIFQKHTRWPTSSKQALVTKASASSQLSTTWTKLLTQEPEEGISYSNFMVMGAEKRRNQIMKSGNRE